MDYNQIKTPGVYIDEIPHLPPSIASVPTAIPAFIGYTEIAPSLIEPGAVVKKPTKISSIFEYQQYYGSGFEETDISITIAFDSTQPVNPAITTTKTSKKPTYLMYYALQMFYANGGGECYIVSVGDYSANGIISENDLKNGLQEIEKIRDVTLISFPDAVNMDATSYYNLHSLAIAQCVKLQDRFTVMDVWIDDTPPQPGNPPPDNVQTLRSAALYQDLDDLKYAAVYYPRIYAQVGYVYDEANTSLKITNEPNGKNYDGKLNGAKGSASSYYYLAVNQLQQSFYVLMPASTSILGIYARVDDSRGVWKAPANEEIINAVQPEISITNTLQDGLNVDADAGKSVNVIRSFPGRGPAIVWGARTLSGNSNEWRYISVRRFFIMAEQSIKNATEQFVFEPNDQHTWLRIRSMIEIYLTQQWKAGALMGSSTKEAFFVHVGLGQTMTEDDIWNGRLIVQIGLAVVRPAEFIILQFMHKMLSES
ncbi:MAG TPA: phage tail sheath C-terminal domain-containing protein [Puia sp.]|nr:phage tail sheath C-terminal domain-containing protein [Puia sp.]